MSKTPSPTRARWCFTQWELASPERIAACRGTDELFADGGEETRVIVQRDGTVTNRYADGVRGVSDAARECADTDESPTKRPTDQARNTGGLDDTFADHWQDVIVNPDGSPTLLS